MFCCYYMNYYLKSSNGGSQKLPAVSFYIPLDLRTCLDVLTFGNSVCAYVCVVPRLVQYLEFCQCERTKTSHQNPQTPLHHSHKTSQWPAGNTETQRSSENSPQSAVTPSRHHTQFRILHRSSEIWFLVQKSWPQLVQPADWAVTWLVKANYWWSRDRRRLWISKHCLVCDLLIFQSLSENTECLSPWWLNLRSL